MWVSPITEMLRDLLLGTAGKKQRKKKKKKKKKRRNKTATMITNDLVSHHCDVTFGRTDILGNVSFGTDDTGSKPLPSEC